LNPDALRHKQLAEMLSIMMGVPTFYNLIALMFGLPPIG